MNQDTPQAKGLLDAFKESVSWRKGRPSIEALAVKKGSTGGVGPSGKSKKRSREGGNIAKTSCSLGVAPTPPPPR